MRQEEEGCPGNLSPSWTAVPTSCRTCTNREVGYWLSVGCEHYRPSYPVKVRGGGSTGTCTKFPVRFVVPRKPLVPGSQRHQSRRRNPQVTETFCPWHKKKKKKKTGFCIWVLVLYGNSVTSYERYLSRR